MFQYLWPSSLTKIIRKKIRFSGKGSPKFTQFSIKLDEGISCKNVSTVFSSNHANNYKKLIKNKRATFRLVLIYLLKFWALKNLQKNNSTLLLSIHGDLVPFKQSEKSNGNSLDKNNNIFQTTRFNHTMIFFKLTD